MNGGDGHTLMKGSVEHIPAPSVADLSAGDGQLQASIAVGAQAGYPVVTCPSGANDFPVPFTNTQGASPVIKHVFFIVRENKTFDSLLGDITGVDGDATIMMKATGAEMDAVWTNLRIMARTYATFDNFYTEAVQSTQGHHWTTYGRATDFCERTWGDNLRPVPLCGISDVGRPQEGSLFEWIQGNNLVYTILGEIVGNPEVAPVGFNPIDINYPGGPVQNIPYNDLGEGLLHGRPRPRRLQPRLLRLHDAAQRPHHRCRPHQPHPRHHVRGERRGDGALPRRPLPQPDLGLFAGGPHRGRPPGGRRSHRLSPHPSRDDVPLGEARLRVADPHRRARAPQIFAHVFGLPYNNLEVMNAGIPFDAFTSTPDYTPYTYKPHSIPLGCGTQGSRAEQRLTESWDFSQPDQQPGLGDQVRRWMRGQQLTELPPASSARSRSGTPGGPGASRPPRTTTTIDPGGELDSATAGRGREPVEHGDGHLAVALGGLEPERVQLGRLVGAKGSLVDPALGEHLGPRRLAEPDSILIAQ